LVYDRDAGLFCHSPTQRNRPPRNCLFFDPVAALQRDFSEADIEHRQIDRNWNRPFATPLTDVSYAENLAIG